MDLYPFRKMRSLTVVLGLVLCWSVLGLADSWDRMRISKLDPRRDSPRVSLKTLDGKKVSLSDYKGKVVFVNFWTTWCGYCKREMPSMEKLYQKFKDKGFVILAIDVRESADKVASFWKKYDLTFPAVIDASGMAAMAFGVRGYPATYFIDRHGKIVGGAPGAREWFSEEAQAIVAELVAEKGPTSEGGDEQAKSDEHISEEQVIEHQTEPETPLIELSSIAGPPILSQGDTLVRNSQLFDLDGGIFDNEKTADFSWSEIGFSTRYLIPQNGAEFARKGNVEQVTFDDIILSKYSGSPINGSEGENNKLKPGTIIYARTNEGRYACVRVNGNDGKLTLSWVTYEKD